MATVLDKFHRYDLRKGSGRIMGPGTVSHGKAILGPWGNIVYGSWTGNCSFSDALRSQRFPEEVPGGPRGVVDLCETQPTHETSS